MLACVLLCHVTAEARMLVPEQANGRSSTSTHRDSCSCKWLVSLIALCMHVFYLLYMNCHCLVLTCLLCALLLILHALYSIAWNSNVAVVHLCIMWYCCFTVARNTLGFDVACETFGPIISITIYIVYNNNSVWLVKRTMKVLTCILNARFCHSEFQWRLLK